MKNIAKKNKFLNLSIISTLISVGVLAYLAQHYYALKFGAVEGSAFCNVNEVLNCDAVTASKFSSFLNVPVALWGAVTNLVLLYILTITRFNLTQDRAKTSRFALLFSGVTVAASIIMGGISMTMNNLCIFCISTYVLSLIGFFGAAKGTEGVTVQQLFEDVKDIFFSQRWILGFLIAIPAISLLANTMYLDSQGYSQIEKIAQEKVAYWQTSPVQNFDLSTGLNMQKSNEQPVMTIVEFADFRCPHCKHAAPSMHAFALSHKDVKFIFKPFPLDGTCNEAIQGGGDGISCGLASAVICAEKISSKGWFVHDYLFEHQEEIVQAQNLDSNLEVISKVTSLPLENLKTCVKDPATQDVIRKMAKEGETAKIQGTPTIFVNGKVLNGGQLIPILEATYKTLKH
ncbi:MAG: vitamin K epoxide reductase/DsbA family protein [Bdellovibrio sp.]